MMYNNKGIGSCHQFLRSFIIVTCGRHAPLAGPPNFFLVAIFMTLASALIIADADAGLQIYVKAPHLRMQMLIFADANISGINTSGEMWEIDHHITLL